MQNESLQINTETHMNTKIKAAVIATFAAVVGLIGLWPSLSQHSYATGPRTVEQFKIVFLNNSGENPEAELNKASSAGWIFKAALGDKAVLFTK